ncbi:PRC-barrel domain-containing protein [Streptomyces sp. NPDC052701]|uniref:PRC-barrel domain-containing protein n=1 Tax=Streptomyces sp. NPDC052701 TaxID=3155533 RepID=UPI0034148A18
MMLFSQAHGLPVLTPSGTDEIGVVRALTVDAAAGRVTHLRVRTGRRAETVLPWEAVHAVGPGAVVVGPAGAPDEVAPHHDLLGRRVLTETGDRHGTVRDVAFDPATGRIEAVRTTLGTLPADRLVGLGDYALVVRAD